MSEKKQGIIVVDYPPIDPLEVLESAVRELVEINRRARTINREIGAIIEELQDNMVSQGRNKPAGE